MPSLPLFDMRVAITGGTSGLGRALAEAARSMRPGGPVSMGAFR